jgi:two-component system, sensor histidine kinase and response regulator
VSLERIVNQSFQSSNARALDVLVVEDNASSQRLFAGILESAGHQVRIAANGVDAIRQFVQQTPDIVLMDWQLPVLDGVQTTRVLRTLFDRQVPIIATTARTSPLDRDRFLAAGVDSFLQKPFEAARLRRLIRELSASAEAAELRHASAHVAAGEPSESGDTEPPLDIPGALVRLGGQEELLDDLVRFFFEDACPLVDKIRSGIADHDWELTRRAAHSLKGLSANFGAGPTVAALQKIESCTADSEPEFRAFLAIAERRLARLMLALADFWSVRLPPRDRRS